MESIERFFRQAWLSFNALFGWVEPKIYFFVKVVNPILQLVFFCLLAKYVYHTNNLTTWVIGNSFLLCIYNCIFGIGGDLRVERYYGTLKMVMASPANKFITFFQRGSVHIIDAASTVIIGFVAGIVFFNVSFKGVNLLVLLLITLVAMFAATGLGLLLGSFGLITSDMNLLMNTVAMVLLALCGANFPIEKFPYAVQQISYCLPLTRSIKAANLIMKGRGISAVNSLIIGEFIIGIVYIVIGYLLLIAMENMARRKATLDIY